VCLKSPVSATAYETVEDRDSATADVNGGGAEEEVINARRFIPSGENRFADSGRQSGGYVYCGREIIIRSAGGTTRGYTLSCSNLSVMCHLPGSCLSCFVHSTGSTRTTCTGDSAPPHI
jgi:hypothetical protein